MEKLKYNIKKANKTNMPPLASKAGFTLAEGATHTNMPPLKKLPSLAREGLRVGLFPARGKAAFTLVEVLITLAIIGVVAALTLPTLIAKVNAKVDGNQKKVTEAKLIQGLNMLDLHGGINNTYSSTAEFVEELSKYMKITKICDGTNSAFTECIPYNEVSFIDMDKKLKTTTVENLQTLSKIGLINPFMKPAAITLADGTPMILSYKKDCISDPDSIKSDNKVIHSCVAGVYDLNYHHKPNMFGKDLIGFNGAHIGIFSKIGDYYILAPAATPPAKNCETYKNDFPEIISHCPYSGESDYWVGALVTCKEMGGHLPTMTELANIAKAVYPNITSGDAIGKYSGTSYGSWNTTEVAKLGIAPSSVSAFLLWSSEEYSTTSNGARIRTFRSGDTHASNYAHTGTGLMFVCLADN